MKGADTLMIVMSICQSVHAQWQALTRSFWPANSQQLTQEEIARLGEELRLRFHGLVQRQKRIAELRRRLSRLEKRQIDLVSLSQQAPETISVFDLALQAEQLRLKIQQMREDLARLERKYAHRLQVYDQRRHLHRALLRGQVVVAEEPTTPPVP